MPSRRVVVVLVTATLLLLTNGPVFHVAWRVLGHEVAWEGPVVREVHAAVAVAGAVLGVLALRTRRAPLVGGPGPAAVLAFSALAMASVVWSIDPSVTLARAPVYGGLAGWAVVVAGLDARERRVVLTAVAGAAVGLGLLAVAISGEVAVDHRGDWRGIHPTRNALGPLAGIGVVMGLGWALERSRWHRRGGAALAAVSGVALWGTGSRTALVATLVASASAGGALLVARNPDRWRRSTVVGGGALAVVAVGVGFWAWDASTIASRRDLWGLVWERIGDRPVLGHGWFTVWKVPGFVGADPRLAVGNAHNSALDVLLGIGLLGLAAFLAVVVLALLGAGRAAVREPGPATAAWFGVVVLLTVEHLTESFVLMFSYNWVLLMAAAWRCGAGWPRWPARRRPTPSAAATGSPHRAPPGRSSGRPPTDSRLPAGSDSGPGAPRRRPAAAPGAVPAGR
jgi:exopolysaccharide production protein ExoQ